MKKQILATMLLCLTGAASYAGAVNNAPAQDSGCYFHQGDWLVGFDGSYNYLGASSGGESAHLNLFLLDAGVSYFVMDNFSVGLNTDWLYAPKTEGVSLTAGGLELDPKYYFQVNDHFIPYVGAHGGLLYGKVDADGMNLSKTIWDLGADLGVIVPINQNVYMDFGLKYTWYYNIQNTRLETFQAVIGLNIKL